MLRCYVARGASRTAYGLAVIGSILLPLDSVPSVAPTFAPAGVYMALYDWLHSNMKRVSENLQSRILRRHRLVNVLLQEGVHPAVAALTSGDLSPAITCFLGCLDCCPCDICAALLVSKTSLLDFRITVPRIYRCNYVRGSISCALVFVASLFCFHSCIHNEIC